MAEQNRHINFIGIEAQQDVLYYAAQKVAEKQLSNVRLLVFDINNVMNLFAPGEVNRFYINFCDPWPKARHDKRRLTHHRFLDMYRQLLAPGGDIHFKTDNELLFAFSLEEFTNYKWQLEQISYDLHASDFANNVMTEYEIKFSTKGGPIYRCEAKPPTII
jgi:tRNA (guanine-N7-)-methyltransferase